MSIRKILQEMDASRPADQPGNGDLPSPALPVNPEAAYDGTAVQGKQPNRPADQVGGVLPENPTTPDNDPAGAIQPGEGTEVQGNFAEEFKKSLIEGFKFDVDSSLVEGLMESQELEESFKTQAIDLFKSMVTSTIQEEFEKVAGYAATILEQAIVDHTEVLEAEVESYTSHVSAKWLNENKVAVDQGIKVTIAESFMEGLKNLLEAHYVELPEGKRDALQEAVEETREFELKLEQSINENVSLAEEIKALNKKLIVEQALSGLTLVQAEKVREMTESLEFVDEESFKSKVQTLKESLGKVAPAAKTVLDDQPLVEEVKPTKVVDDEVARLASQIGRFSGR